MCEEKIKTLNREQLKAIQKNLGLTNKNIGVLTGRTEGAIEDIRSGRKSTSDILPRQFAYQILMFEYLEKNFPEAWKDILNKFEIKSRAL